jgi:cellulose synthase/poly-beta-1,6-N-acetylglucosamine synthase-like glycosyltransferase
VVETIIATVTWAFLIIAGLPVFYILLLTLAAILPGQSEKESVQPRRIAVLVPAHDESLLIADTVADVLRQRYPQDRYSLLVIADNCSDDTAEKAIACGARVLERSGNPGKGQSLNEGLRLLLDEDWDAFLMMDADSHLHADTLMRLNRVLEQGAKAVQLRYGVLNPGDSVHTRAMELSTASFNALRPRGRTALGISSGIYGNGFCLSREVVQTVPYLAYSIAEDIEYHLHLLKAGFKVVFVEQVWVKAQMPTGGHGSKVQRVRWERGRLRTIKHYAPGLLQSAAKGDRFALDGLLEAMMPPVSVIALLILPPLVLGNPLQKGLSSALVLALSLHYLVAAWRYGSVRSLPRLAFYVPWYIIWKTYVVISSLIAERELGWIRTDRHPSASSQKEDGP